MPFHRKLTTGLRVDSAAGGNEYIIGPESGGSSIKRLLVTVRQIWATTPATDVLTVKIEHSPDGAVWLVHTAYITAAAATNGLWTFDSDSATTLLDNWRVVVKTHTSAGQSQLLDLWVTGKPF